MYDNIGSKIKKLAIILTIAESIVFFIAGVVMLVGEMGGLALLFMFAGPLFAWASSFLLYGFGELIDKVCDIERNTRNLENVKEVENNEQKAEVTVDKKHIDPNKYICNSFFCNRENDFWKMYDLHAKCSKSKLLQDQEFDWDTRNSGLSRLYCYV